MSRDITVEITGDATRFAEALNRAGYNLRGLIVAYLEGHGWTWDSKEESWTNGDEVYTGEYATDLAMQEQIEREEGRSE